MTESDREVTEIIVEGHFREAATEVSEEIKRVIAICGLPLIETRKHVEIAKKYGVRKAAIPKMARFVRETLGGDYAVVLCELGPVADYIRIIKEGERPEDVQTWREMYAKRGAKYSLWIRSAKKLIEKGMMAISSSPRRRNILDASKGSRPESNQVSLEGMADVKAALALLLGKNADRQRELIAQKEKIEEELADLRADASELKDIQNAYEVLRVRAGKLKEKKPI